MDVPVTVLRAQLGDWLDQVRAGEEIIVTDRGVPVARLIGIGSATVIDELTREGVIGKPATTVRPRAHGRRRVKARESVSDLVSDQRR